MTSSMLPPIEPASPQAAREVRRNTALRRARTCYGHLAGVAGVELMGELLKHGWLKAQDPRPEGTRVSYVPSTEGAIALEERGVCIPRGNGGKSTSFDCVDWTERRPHLGGALGRAIVDALVESGHIQRGRGSRPVTICASLERWFDP